MLIPVYLEFSWSPDTKQIYITETGVSVGPSTYERPVSYQPGYGFPQPMQFLNPIGFATDATAKGILSWATGIWGAMGISFRQIVVSSAAVSYPCFCLEATSVYGKEIYNCGWLAFEKDKNGEQAAKQSFEAELRSSGVLK